MEGLIKFHYIPEYILAWDTLANDQKTICMDDIKNIIRGEIDATNFDGKRYDHIKIFIEHVPTKVKLLTEFLEFFTKEVTKSMERAAMADEYLGGVLATLELTPSTKKAIFTKYSMQIPFSEDEIVDWPEDLRDIYHTYRVMNERTFIEQYSMLVFSLRFTINALNNCVVTGEKVLGQTRAERMTIYKKMVTL